MWAAVAWTMKTWPAKARSKFLCPGAVPVATQYASEDSDLTLHVHETLWPQLVAEPKLRDIYERFELPTSRVLQRIERHGVLIDKALCSNKAMSWASASQLEQEAYELAGQPFNLGSPKQLGEILFVKQRLACGEENRHRGPFHE